ncbi:metal-binding protein [Prosthecobacter fluviatilis]|uniref:Metal-binding protein n=1 Tax=Prosthecobacter fluviatilis TaxID=445931 RepID=A0ABW0KPZ9_9BACT
MNITFAYRGRSHVAEAGGGQIVSLAPNLKRDVVAFDAALKNPLHFREAISALHDVVINDLRFKPRDKTAYEEWRKGEQQRLTAIRTEAVREARQEMETKQRTPLPRDFERQFDKARKRYWNARLKYADHLRRHDQELWRLLMPCDPVITVAPDVVFFECFSADESSYGCLSVERDECFSSAAGVQCGTTNVDYSWDLFHHFQTLRTYQPARFHVDPSGFEVKVQGGEDYREEKIDLPTGWLRGFMQLQGAMTLPMRRVTLSRQGLYSLLAWLRRHKAPRSPRALRFEIVEGRAPELVLEPWEQRITDRGAPPCAQSMEPIRVWGVRRLLTLARLLPLIDRVEVCLLGTGLPSMWIAHMGPMKLTLGLSGWTTNDWTRGSALDLLLPPQEPGKDLIDKAAAALRQQQSASLATLASACGAAEAMTTAALKHLAHSGQVIYDLPHQVYRWRQIMPQVLGEEQMGPPNAEAEAARDIPDRDVRVLSSTDAPNDTRLHTGTVQKREVELLLDRDGMMRRAKCDCSHHFKGGLRKGPCRHLIAFRRKLLNPVDPGAPSLYERLWSGFRTNP